MDVLIGRVRGLARPSVCLFPTGFYLATQEKEYKNNIGVSVPQDRTNRFANFQLKRAKVRVKVSAAYCSVGYIGLAMLYRHLTVIILLINIHTGGGAGVDDGG